MQLDHIIARAEKELRLIGIDTPRRECRLLMEKAGIHRLSQLRDPQLRVSAEIERAFSEMIARRCKREPLSRILGEREFWSMNFLTSPAVLDPRPDSETLIEALLERMTDRNRPYRIVDFGTGSACLLLALLCELPKAEGLGIDLSPEALSIARKNARQLGFAERAQFQKGNWGEGLKGPFDILISNPPYIGRQEKLSPEVAYYDPPLALYGGEDGLACYRELIPYLFSLARPKGWIALEIGQGQKVAVEAIAQYHGLHLVEARRDLAGIERCLLFQRS